MCNKAISILSISDDETLLGGDFGLAQGILCFGRTIWRPGNGLAFCGEGCQFA